MSVIDRIGARLKAAFRRLREAERRRSISALKRRYLNLNGTPDAEIERALYGDVLTPEPSNVVHVPRPARKLTPGVKDEPGERRAAAARRLRDQLIEPGTVNQDGPDAPPPAGGAE